MAEKKIKLGLFFGGKSDERDVSLNTGKTIAQYFDKDDYEVIPIEVSKDGKFFLESETINEIAQQSDISKLSSTQDLIAVDKGSKSGIDIAFLALHGPGGEDGTIQGMLELLGIPYTCSGVLGSSLAMNKAKAKRMAATIGVPILPHILLTKNEYKKNKQKILETIKDKVVIKPNEMGSSIGIAIVEGKEEIDKAIQKALEQGREVMVEPFFQGREITVPVLGNDSPRALPAVEILPRGKSKFYDYEAKYEEGGSKHIIPAELDDSETEKVQKQAVDIHKLFSCRGVTRSDFILGEDGEFYFLETNTIPGMTPTSLVPESAQKAGISFSELLDTLVKLSLNDENI